MGSTRNSFMSTYQTTRPAKCLYIDGASGRLGNEGTLDTQMLFLYGNVTGPPGKNGTGAFLWDEYARAQGLCGWLHERDFDEPGHGIEAIVRMSAGFELIWCNFSSPSLRLISRFNASVPLLGYNRTSLIPEKSKETQSTPSVETQGDQEVDLPAPEWEIDWEHEPFVASQQWDWFTSMSRTYDLQDLSSEREPTIKLLDSEVVSLYSPDYPDLQTRMANDEQEQLNLTSDGVWEGTKSLELRNAALQELMRRRHRHRAGNLSPHEITTLHRSIEKMVSRLLSQGDPHTTSASHPEVSWTRTSDLIVNTFAKPLMHFQQLLQHSRYPPQQPQEQRRQFALLRETAHGILMPFFSYQPHPQPQPQHQQHESSLSRCKSIYLPSYQSTSPQNNKAHHFLAQATEEVLQNICSTLITIGVAIEEVWLRDFNNFNFFNENTALGLDGLQRQMREWREQVEELTAWLGYIPIWPTYRQLPPLKPAYGNREINPEIIEEDLWAPRCLKRSEFATDSSLLTTE
ncbi:MAG: hypothetical protein Q9212_002455 [Teloschistes hypoglaucus]